MESAARHLTHAVSPLARQRRRGTERPPAHVIIVDLKSSILLFQVGLAIQYFIVQCIVSQGISLSYFVVHSSPYFNLA